MKLLKLIHEESNNIYVSLYSMGIKILGSTLEMIISNILHVYQSIYIYIYDNYMFNLYVR